jgi:hypothetical protein
MEAAGSAGFGGVKVTGGGSQLSSSSDVSSPLRPMLRGLPLRPADKFLAGYAACVTRETNWLHDSGSLVVFSLLDSYGA